MNPGREPNYRRMYEETAAELDQLRDSQAKIGAKKGGMYILRESLMFRLGRFCGRLSGRLGKSLGFILLLGLCLWGQVSTWWILYHMFDGPSCFFVCFGVVIGGFCAGLIPLTDTMGFVGNNTGRQAREFRLILLGLANLPNNIISVAIVGLHAILKSALDFEE